MTDVHDRRTRSYNMSRIRSKDTKPELLVRKFLFGKGLRYKLHDKSLPGTPDLVFPKYKAVVFVHGCFWHGHKGCRYFVIPATRTDWWSTKILRTKELDRQHADQLKTMGWRVITVYECELRPPITKATLERVIMELSV